MKYDFSIGQRCGRLILRERVRDIKNRWAWRCDCDCGGSIVMSPYHLAQTKLPGCLSCHNVRRTISKFKHGGSGTRLLRIWHAMLNRCENPNAEAYPNYGGKGVRVCKEWHDFALFREWAHSHGYLSDLTIDRMDANGSYEPKNCQWVTRSENSKRMWRKLTPEQRFSEGNYKWMRKRAKAAANAYEAWQRQNMRLSEYLPIEFCWGCS